MLCKILHELFLNVLSPFTFLFVSYCICFIQANVVVVSVHCSLCFLCPTLCIIKVWVLLGARSPKRLSICFTELFQKHCSHYHLPHDWSRALHLKTSSCSEDQLHCKMMLLLFLCSFIYIVSKHWEACWGEMYGQMHLITVSYTVSCTKLKNEPFFICFRAHAQVVWPTWIPWLIICDYLFRWSPSITDITLVIIYPKEIVLWIYVLQVKW